MASVKLRREQYYTLTSLNALTSALLQNFTILNHTICYFGRDLKKSDIMSGLVFSFIAKDLMSCNEFMNHDTVKKIIILLNNNIY